MARVRALVEPPADGAAAGPQGKDSVLAAKAVEHTRQKAVPWATKAVEHTRQKAVPWPAKAV